MGGLVDRAANTSPDGEEPEAALHRNVVDDQAIALATAEARRASRWRCREELL